LSSFSVRPARCRSAEGGLSIKLTPRICSSPCPVSFRDGADFVKLVLYLMFTYVIVKHYGLPLHIIRDLYFTLRSFATRLVEMIQYRRATYNMNERYPDATEAELAATDRTCIICREDMEVGKKVWRPAP